MVPYSLTVNTFHGKTADLVRYFHDRIPNFCIDEKMRKALCFRERLEIFYKNSYTAKLEPIGSYLISVESVGSKSQEFFMQIILSMENNEQSISSRVTCSATKELHCIEEKKYEYMVTNSNSCKRQVYVGHGDDGYFLKTIENSIDDEPSQSTCISYNDITFLSDGCNALLMRYLAMTNFCGTLCFDVITMEGKVIECTFECSRMDMKIKNIKVSKIIQRFYVDDTINNTIETILSKQGNILSINFADFPYIIKLNPHVDLNVKHENPITLPLREEWKQDFELISKHFDKIVYEKDRKKKYLQLHLEMNEILSDYIQRLLCRKPDDVLQFTIDHFNLFISDTQNLNARN